MTDNTVESELTQRKATKDEPAQTDDKEESKESPKSETKQEFESSWHAVKYYWYKFRYYHFKVADTIDLYVSAACLWLINLYLRLFMGIGPEPQSALTEE